MHRSFSGTVFIVDKVKDDPSMQQGFEGQPVELTTIRYTREDGNVARFNQGSKAVVVEQWEKISETIEAVFGS